MKLLLLAPHPFYQERGTPIAVNLLLEAYAARGVKVDVLTYHEGHEVTHAGVTIHRIRRPPLVYNVGPGFSLKKVICDLWMLFRIPALIHRGRYNAVHAVEESVFLAMLIKACHGIPYIYDMDSSMPRQIVEKHPRARLLLPVMNWFERRAVRGALAVVPMCDSLADAARADGARQVFVLRDISLLDPAAPVQAPGLKETLGIKGLTFVYIGNLEKYQGVDLLLDAFRLAHERGLDADLVIAGGSPADVTHYRRVEHAASIGRVHLLGHQPVTRMPWLIAGSDVLVSPRITGTNTPMKIYSYLDAGRAILATDLPTHTQVLSPAVAALVPPVAEEMAMAMCALAADPARRAALGGAARELAVREYSRAAFHRNTDEIIEWLARTTHGPRL